MSTRPDFSKARIGSADEWQLIRDLYAETYPIRPLLNHVDELERQLDSAQSRITDLSATLKKAQMNCEHEWAETLDGPDKVGEHCLHCDVDRDYDDSDGYGGLDG